MAVFQGKSEASSINHKNDLENDEYQGDRESFKLISLPIKVIYYRSYRKLNCVHKNEKK